jgi:hypothetical protein
VPGALGARSTAAPGAAGATRLRAFERGWAEALFAALLPGDPAHGLPPFGAIDRTQFWQCLARAPAPSFGLGLRAMVYTLSFLPVTDKRFRRPFFRLSAREQALVIEELARDPRFAARQMVTALKTLACLAYFDDGAVRARVGGDPPGASEPDRTPEGRS